MGRIKQMIKRQRLEERLRGRRQSGRGPESSTAAKVLREILQEPCSERRARALQLAIDLLEARAYDAAED